MATHCNKLPKKTMHYFVVAEAFKEPATLHRAATHSITLQRTASYCIMLKHIATHRDKTHCTARQNTATRRNKMQKVKVHYNVVAEAFKEPATLHRAATQCITLHHTTSHRNTLQHTPKKHIALHGNTRQCAATNYKNHQCIMMWWRLQIASRAALRCNTLHHTASHCNILQHIVEKHIAPPGRTRNTPQHTAQQKKALQCSGGGLQRARRAATHCKTPHCTATHCITLQHTAKKRKTHYSVVAEAFKEPVAQFALHRAPHLNFFSQKSSSYSIFHVNC